MRDGVGKMPATQHFGRTPVRVGPPRHCCACSAALLGCGGRVAMYCVTDL